LQELGMEREALRDYYRLYTANAPAFRDEAATHE
jgi:hypothetical protein